MFATAAAIAGSLRKPAWLAEAQQRWMKCKSEGADLAQAKREASLLWIKHKSLPNRTGQDPWR